MNTATQVELWLQAVAGTGRLPAADDARRRLVLAEVNLRRTWRRLQMVRSAAFIDEYDPDACETAALLYRQALQDVHQARAACECGPASPAAPIPRLLFARWLVQTGRLSEGLPRARGPATRA
jgi:hypothetical protein